ncbi:hypothetical protein CDO52_03575 [Nocardiopsis gilva YIM 90087]|uniref:Uncharacterized protein n=1 Tax=Nocardiopsis gilva YIM 90087 TaxID=1235441 RepID=A0A223S1H1_9ACTN|nr:hypothetical protein CDO52_03575 [Nocardiopsis gilva YIM 90087]
MRGGTGSRITLDDDPFVAIRPDAEAAFAELCTRHGVPATEVGTVGGTSPSAHGGRTSRNTSAP